MSFAFESAFTLAKKIRNREVSSRELTEYFIRRIERFDKQVNAVVVRDFDRAIEAADRADVALSRSDKVGPLHGVPITIKEAYDVTGLPTTWGHPELTNNIADKDSDTVAKYKRSGAHFLGKSNVPLRLADFQSYNDIYGTTNNPWDVARTPGGSSGGSAAALAAGLTCLESGSDIGGSIRNPAHYCGVYGHKPTWGVVPPQGHGLPGSYAPTDMAVVGPMARSATDLSAALDIVAGPQPLDRRAWTLKLPRPTKKAFSEYRVAIWLNDPHAPVSAETSGRVQAVGDRLANLGAAVSDTARPDIDIDDLYNVYTRKLISAMSSGTSDEDFNNTLEAASRFNFDDISDEAIDARSNAQYHREWLKDNDKRELYRMAWRAFFDEWDILVCPIMQTPAFPHIHSQAERTIVVDDKIYPYFGQLFWAGIITVGNLPSTVFPTGPSTAGLPIGLQAVGAEFDDHICIDFSRLIADEFGGFTAPAGYDD